mmetsp:Transcript_1952/g.5811  ORF Transcript_1952/g.5811 Transcript_1952/m.5811 type:complete len:169 (-) Transcript_1952:305-811(-)
MPESTMICLDTSEWMRNGDYVPSRLDAQQDAANLLSTTKCDLNPENTVGLLTMGRDRVELLASPTEDAGRLLSAIAGISMGGKSSVCSGIAIARLALKHRRNKANLNPSPNLNPNPNPNPKHNPNLHTLNRTATSASSSSSDRPWQRACRSSRRPGRCCGATTSASTS